MTRPGPPPTPTRLLLDRGSKKAKGRSSEASYPKGAPTCPRSLSVEGKKEWRRVVRMLLDADVLQKTDLAMLAAYCRCWSEWVLLCEKSAGWDYGVENDRKQARLLGDVEKRLQKFASEFGFTPSARVRVTAPAKEEEKEDAVERFLNKRSRA